MSKSREEMIYSPVFGWWRPIHYVFANPSPAEPRVYRALKWLQVPVPNRLKGVIVTPEGDAV